jgi:Bacteriophage tail sheath protein
MTTYTYPGVYIEEVPSGIHTIVGVATSITAFIGWAAQGPTAQATLVQSWPEYQRVFGGLDSRSYLGYAVNQFFNNGGQQAYIIRLVDTATAGAATVNVPDTGGGTAFVATASSQGMWATSYGVRIVVNPAQPARFSVLVVHTPSGGTESVVESFVNLSNDTADPLGRYVGSVINDNDRGSRYIRLSAITNVSPSPNPPGGANPAYALAGVNLDGNVLDPGTPAFHAALNATNTGAGGVYLLDRVDLFNILCVPAEVDPTTIQLLQGYCSVHRAFLIVDSDSAVNLTALQQNGPNALITGPNSINSALYYPWVDAPDPLQQGRIETYPPCGFVAGIYASTDASRGVWKAPAGVEAGLTGVSGLEVSLTDLENGTLNVQAINCLRSFRTYGDVVWGARTLRGNDQVGSEWKYVPVRRLALYLEESLYRATKWAVFEPNDTPLWAQLRLNIGAFMHDLYRKGAFQGESAREAYFVKCDAQTTTQNDIDSGVVNIWVGFAPLKPAEFVVIQIQQMAGQVQA